MWSRLGESDQHMSTPDPEYVDPKELKPGPIRQEALPDDLLKLMRLERVFDIRTSQKDAINAF